MLTELLGEHDLLIAGQRVTDHLKDHEIDFVVAIEGAGIVCVEVKDFIEADPRWIQGRLRWDHVVVLSNSQVPQHFGLPDSILGRWRKR